MRSAPHAPLLPLLFAGFLAILPGCESTPLSAETRDRKIADARHTLSEMIEDDSSIESALDDAHGYAVIPTVGSGAFIVGGEGGRGIVFKGDRPWGTVTLSKGSIGLQIGGEVYSELIILRTEEAFERFTGGQVSFSAEATAVAIKAGAAAAAPVADGMQVLVMTRGGLMASAAIGGQDFSCTPFQD